MNFIKKLSIVLTIILLSICIAKENITSEITKKVDDLLSKMTLEEKVLMLAGKNSWNTNGVPRLGVPSLQVTDGPHGIRSTGGDGVSGPNTCMPTGVGMASTWNRDLIYRVGKALGEEVVAKQTDILLGPCINLHRTPLGGRNFESYSEDPFLVGEIGVQFVNGAESNNIGTSLKHYACNNQEYERFTISAEVDERTLREFYLAPFRKVITEAQPWTVMCSYNRINGNYASANKHLLTEILRDDWKYEGFVISDWGSVHDDIPVVKAGLSTEMPGPGLFLNENLVDAVKSGKLIEDEIDNVVRPMLAVIVKNRMINKKPAKEKGSVNTKDHQLVAREVAAEGIVLLKNDNDILPLDKNKIKSIAVIGPTASRASLGGGGSSVVTPPYSVSPLDGIKKILNDDVQINYAKGCGSEDAFVDIPVKHLIPSLEKANVKGIKASYYNTIEPEGKPVFTEIVEKMTHYFHLSGAVDAQNDDNYSISWTGYIVAPETGTYSFSLISDDKSRFFINDEKLIDNWDEYVINKLFYCEYKMNKGEKYFIKLDFCELEDHSGIRFKWLIPSENGSVEDAVVVAKKSDVSLIFVGLNHILEGEGNDRETMTLPEIQVKLIKTVAKSSEKTIVCLNNGTPIDMRDWISDVGGLVELWYPGMEGGSAVADILFGNVNPSGKLTFTFPEKYEDNPSYSNYPGKDGKVNFAEGLFVGYRHYDKNNIKPQFPFGFGLSYTDFEFSDLKITNKIKVGENLKVRFKITNTGNIKGKEVCQVYLRDIKSTVIKPIKTLVGFEKVELKPDETKSVIVEIDSHDMAYWDIKTNSWQIEKGKYEILVGNSSQNIYLKKQFKVK